LILSAVLEPEADAVKCGIFDGFMLLLVAVKYFASFEDYDDDNDAQRGEKKK
jgi:hypothetical protein